MAKTEGQVYSQLKDLQGRSIPRMYAEVKVVPRPGDVPDDLPDPGMMRYFEIKGYLMELISGCSLDEYVETFSLPTWSVFRTPAILEEKQKVVEAAIDIASEINKRGVILEDLHMNNVMVDLHIKRPYMIDFALCHTREDWLTWTTAKGYYYGESNELADKH